MDIEIEKLLRKEFRGKWKTFYNEGYLSAKTLIG